MTRTVLLASAFAFMTSTMPAAPVSSEPWGKTAAGQEVTLFTLRNAQGMQARICTYGGILVSLTAPDREGKLADVVLGFDSLDRYLAKNPFFGCITGRYANRIGGASFKIDGIESKVAANSANVNHIHGGLIGFDKKVWAAKPFEKSDSTGVALTYTSPDGEEGFPGTLQCTVTYTLSDDSTFAIDYQATTDKPTVVNLTNHSYFNLAGEGSGDVLGHEVTIPAEGYTATDDLLIPTGEIAPLTGTPLDFTQPHAIGERIGSDFKALVQGIGYDHNYVLKGTGMKLAARVKEPKSGRIMEVRTTEPGVQLYTANHLKGVVGKNGHTYETRNALCLETQKFPDSPNQPSFPSAVLRPGETYHHATTFTFSAE